jgi:hypothetical protein
VKQKKVEKAVPKKEDTNQKYKLLQTLYTDSISNNYYYTTLYIGDKKAKQTYLIDTGTAVMSSPCVQSPSCGKHKTHYLDESDKKSNVPLKCSSKICNMVPSTECNSKDKNKDKKNCGFNQKKSKLDELKGYYLSNIVYFEEAQNPTTGNQKKVYRSYALPIGCTTLEYGFYKEMKPDGVMGLDNERNSFISLLYSLKIIDKNLFSLCFGSEGGYMSLGEIDTTYHSSKKIDYIPLIDSPIYYSFYLNGIYVGNNKKSLSTKLEAYIDTTRALTSLPKAYYKSLIKEFDNFCTPKKGKNKCGEMEYVENYGYCADFYNRKSLLNAIEYWPSISLRFKDFNYIWRPIDYYYSYNKGKVIKACIGFKSHQSDKVILGINFMHGNDVIFNREKQLLGIVRADCSGQNNLLYNKGATVTKGKGKETNKSLKDTQGNKGENEELTFIKGKNKELEFNNSEVFNFVILLISILIIIVVVLTVIVILMYKNREYSKLQTVSDESNKIATQNNVMEEINDTRITQEEVQFLRKMMKNPH